MLFVSDLPKHRSASLKLLQLGLEFVHLGAEVADNLLVFGDVEVDADDVAHNSGFDVLCAVGICQRVVCVLERHAGWTHISNHDSLAVAAKRVLENAC